MSSGEIFLTAGAVILLLYMGVNVSRIYTSSVKESVQVQREMEVIDYGQSLSELMYSQSTNYEDFPSDYGNLNDVTNPSNRLSYETKTGNMLYATIEISNEKELMYNVSGRIATITVYDEDDGEYIQKGRFFAAITPISTNS